MPGIRQCLFLKRDQYRSVRSIIDFQPDENVPYGDYVVGVEQQYATVRANPKFIENCKVAESVPQAQVGLLASFYIPVVGELFLLTWLKSLKKQTN